MGNVQNTRFATYQFKDWEQKLGRYRNWSFFTVAPLYATPISLQDAFNLCHICTQKHYHSTVENRESSNDQEAKE